MKLPYRYQNVRLKDYHFLIKSFNKWAELQLEYREQADNPLELPDSYENHYAEYYQTAKTYYLRPILAKIREAKNRKLNIQEYALLYGYTAYYISSRVNSDLRNLKKVKKYSYDVWLYNILLNKVLNKLPSYNDEVVYHAMQYLTENEIENLLEDYNRSIGNIITFSYFLSTHWENVRIADTLYLEIYTKKINSRAKKISRLSFVANEKEVLFKSGSRFKILQVLLDDKRVIIQEI